MDGAPGDVDECGCLDDRTKRPAAMDAVTGKPFDLAKLIRELPTQPATPEDLQRVAGLPDGTVEIYLTPVPFLRPPDEITVTYAEVVEPPRVHDLTKHPEHDHGDGPRPCFCGGTGQAARCTTPGTHNWDCDCPHVPVWTKGQCPYCTGSANPDIRDHVRNVHPDLFEEWRDRLSTEPMTDPFEDDTQVPVPQGGSTLYPEPTSVPLGDVLRHPYNGAGRLHGICRCGEGPGGDIHDG
jgi:hypothetical protein